MRVLSGMQPSGQLHLGNYFASMLPNLERSKAAEESIFFIADLHSLTTIHDKDRLRQLREDALKDYLAIGFDPEDTVMFYQSDVPEHTELMWVLTTLCPMGLLERAVSYKDKVAKGITASAGLFTYPVLMAADILLYDINQVPVGKDQKQHVEIARDLALKFNNTFGETLIVPEPIIAKQTAVIPGIDGQKMSKSYGNYIPLFDTEGTAKKRIMSIETDSKDKDDPKDPDTCTIYQIHKLFLNPEEQVALADEYRNGLPYGEAKKKLFQTYTEHFAEFTEVRNSFTADYIQDVAAAGAKKARAYAKATLDRVHSAVGL